MFYQLLEMAKENTAEARGALMLGLADILVRGIEKRSEEELQMFGEIAVLLYTSAPKPDRIQLSRKIASELRTPINLAMTLASDDISIALPVLEKFPAFNPENLLRLAEELDDEHLQVLARRTDINTKVSDKLVRRGSKVVHRILAGNREIRLSQIALKALVRHAVQDVVLREDLALRSDLTPTVCTMLMPHVRGATQKRLQKLITGVLSKSDLDKLARLRELRKEHGARIDQLDGKPLWDYAQASEISLNELVVLMLQDERLAHVADLLGQQARVAAGTARNAVFKGDVEQIVAIAQSAGLSTDAFSLLAKARCKHLRIPSSKAAEWISAYVAAQTGNNAGKKRRGDGAFAAKRRVRPRRDTTRRLAAI